MGAGGERGQVAGMPQYEELFQATEDAGQAGQNQGVQGRRQPAPVGAG